MNYDNTKMIRVFQTAGNILQNITEMSLPRGKFSASQLDSLRKAYEKINTVDPNSPAAKRMFELLDSMSKDQLKQVIDGNVVKEDGDNGLGEALQGISAAIENYRSMIKNTNVGPGGENLSPAEKRKLISLTKEITNVQIKIDNLLDKML
jgi:hypothetical protein